MSFSTVLVTQSLLGVSSPAQSLCQQLRVEPVLLSSRAGGTQQDPGDARGHAGRPTFCTAPNHALLSAQDAARGHVAACTRALGCSPKPPTAKAELLCISEQQQRRFCGL